MPIEVRHDVPAGIQALAGLMAGRGAAAVSETEALRVGGRQIAAQEAQATRQREQIRAQQAQQAAALGAQRAAQMRQIEAQADRDKQAAETSYKQTALKFGLGEQIQESEFENELEKMQEAARVKASQFEYQFTAKQRQEIARFNDARQRIQASDAFSPEEKESAMRAIELQQAGITPSAVPADPNKPQFAEGREPGNEFQDQGGNWHMVQPDGTSKMTLRWDQGPEAAKLKYEAEQEKATLDLQAAQRKTWQAAKLKLLEQRTTETDTEGNEIDVPMYRGPGAERLLEEAGYVNPDASVGVGAEEQEEQAVIPWKVSRFDAINPVPGPPPQAMHWMQAAPRTEADADLSEEAAGAQAFLRAMLERMQRQPDYQPSEQVKEAMRMAEEILSGSER